MQAHLAILRVHVGAHGPDGLCTHRPTRRGPVALEGLVFGDMFRELGEGVAAGRALCAAEERHGCGGATAGLVGSCQGFKDWGAKVLVMGFGKGDEVEVGIDMEGCFVRDEVWCRWVRWREGRQMIWRVWT